MSKEPVRDKNTINNTGNNARNTISTSNHIHIGIDPLRAWQLFADLGVKSEQDIIAKIKRDYKSQEITYTEKNS